jgi:hypothetical protein
MTETSEIFKIPTLNGTDNWIQFRKDFLDYCDKFPDIRGMLTELTEPNWSERLQELTSSFITMDVAEIRKTEEAEPSGAITRTKAAKEKAEAEEKAANCFKIDKHEE